jgi:hypothetical protein
LLGERGQEARRRRDGDGLGQLEQMVVTGHEGRTLLGARAIKSSSAGSTELTGGASSGSAARVAESFSQETTASASAIGISRRIFG